MGGLRVIFIGPDCGGKSSVAALVGQALGARVYGHRKIADPVDATYKVITEPSISSVVVKDMIYDQWMFPVDIIYSRTLGSKPSPLEGLHDSLAALYKKHRYVFVYITADEEVIEERFSIRGDELWDLPQIQAVRGSYEHYWQDNEVNGWHNMIRIDSSHLTTEEAAEQVLDQIKDQSKWNGVKY